MKVAVAILMLVVLGGCAGSGTQKLVAPRAASPTAVDPSPASQPATIETEQVVAAQQGAINAIATATQKLDAKVDTAVTATGLAYTSQFGLGPSILLGLALVLTLFLSHLREMARLRASQSSQPE